MSSEYFDYQLTIDTVLDSGVNLFPTREIVYRDLRRYTFSSFADSVKRLLTGLKKDVGVSQGERIGVIDWDTDVYLHAYYAIPMSGAVLHTVNLRFPTELLFKTILQAEDKYLIVRDELLPMIEKAINILPAGMKFIVYNDKKEKVKSSLSTINFWDLVDYNEPSEPQGLKEDMMATIFFTSGTTGEPKGVWFNHRKLVLHTIVTSLANSMSQAKTLTNLLNTIVNSPLANLLDQIRSSKPLPLASLTSSDTALMLVPMFHVHQWGFPYQSILTGIKNVLPGRYDYSLILKLLDKEKVTFSAMVPTIFYFIITHPDASKYQQAFKRWRVAIGGSALPEGLAKKAQELGITILGNGYGLSETAPILTTSYYNSLVENADEATKERVLLSQGTALPFVKINIVDPATGEEKKRGEVGEIVVRAPWLTQEYYKDPQKTQALWRGGWLHTGDLGYIDEYGYLHLVDRVKDAIKSGGEFIPSLLLENAISLHPKVDQVAVVGMKDEKWGERPVAFIVPKGDLKEEELREFLLDLGNKGKIQKWWIPDKFIFVDKMPLTSTNKIDKKALRSRLES